MHFKNIKISVILIILALLFSSCSVLENLDQKAGELLKTIGGEKSEEDISSEKENNDKIDIDIKEITSRQKKKIDKWLEDNNLNRYGDAEDTMYMGGTPLFDEITGEAIERLEYLLDKHPDLVNSALGS